MKHTTGTKYTACGIPVGDLPDVSTGDPCPDCAMANRVGTDMRWRTGNALRTAARAWSDRAITSDPPH